MTPKKASNERGELVPFVPNSSSRPEDRGSSSQGAIVPSNVETGDVSGRVDTPPDKEKFLPTLAAILAQEGVKAAWQWFRKALAAKKRQASGASVRAPRSAQYGRENPASSEYMRLTLPSTAVDPIFVKSFSEFKTRLAHLAKTPRGATWWKSTKGLAFDYEFKTLGWGNTFRNTRSFKDFTMLEHLLFVGDLVPYPNTENTDLFFKTDTTLLEPHTEFFMERMHKRYQQIVNQEIPLTTAEDRFKYVEEFLSTESFLEKHPTMPMDDAVLDDLREKQLALRQTQREEAERQRCLGLPSTKGFMNLLVEKVNDQVHQAVELGYKKVDEIFDRLLKYKEDSEREETALKEQVERDEVSPEELVKMREVHVARRVELLKEHHAAISEVRAVFNQGYDLEILADGLVSKQLAHFVNDAQRRHDVELAEIANKEGKDGEEAYKRYTADVGARVQLVGSALASFLVAKGGQKVLEIPSFRTAVTAQFHPLFLLITTLFRHTVRVKGYMQYSTHNGVVHIVADQMVFQIIYYAGLIVLTVIFIVVAYFVSRFLWKQGGRALRHFMMMRQLRHRGQFGGNT